MPAELPKYDAEVDAQQTELGKNFNDALSIVDQAKEYQSYADDIDYLQYEKDNTANPIKIMRLNSQQGNIEKVLPPVVRRQDTTYQGSGDGDAAVMVDSRPYEVDSPYSLHGKAFLDALDPKSVEVAKDIVKTSQEKGADFLKKNGAAVEDNAVIEANMDFVKRKSDQRIRTKEVVQEETGELQK